MFAVIVVIARPSLIFIWITKQHRRKYALNCVSIPTIFNISIQIHCLKAMPQLGALQDQPEQTRRLFIFMDDLGQSWYAQIIIVSDGIYCRNIN